MVKQAIINYTQVIKLKPQLADAYYQRARLFEMENESVYANEDLKMVRVLDPENIHAIRHQSQYSFHRQLWNDAIDGFSRLLLLSPEDAEAFLYRGRAQAHINRWDDALNDLTMTIQLAPGNSEGFWQRASLLRERNPTKAIEDYSIALLLEEGEKASDIYLQRAALYSRLGHHGQAIADLHAVLEIDPSKSKAYLHLGGLHLNVLADYDEALICFDKCLHIDPTQVQAHIGRGELFQHLHHQWMQESSRMHGASVVANASVTRPGTRDMNDKSQTNAAGAGNATSHISKATKEYSRAIHLAPGNYMLYLHRGKLLLKNSRMKAATYDFHTAFELNSSIAQTPYQVRLSRVFCPDVV
ncbi:hypothetical protein BC832DRAFT_341312 [Gaertneriomyces semiglobifer]|nr:hypothetical protein BC832DRAFT_341312 [Gaertneriomyces semiglobifer]